MSENAEAPLVAPQLEGRDLIIGVRDILVNNPDRHDQQYWIGNYYLTPDEVRCNVSPIPIDLVREYADQPVRYEPSDPEAAWPMCGSTACACGWGAVLSAPPGSFLDGSLLILPDGSCVQVDEWVGDRMGVTEEQREYVFSPIRARERLIRILDALIENPDTEVCMVQ